VHIDEGLVFPKSPHPHVHNDDDDDVHRGHSHEGRCIESTAHEPKNFYYGEHATPLKILTSDRLSHKLVSHILQVTEAVFIISSPPRGKIL
jgi:hypothetical protein